MLFSVIVDCLIFLIKSYLKEKHENWLNCNFQETKLFWSPSAEMKARRLKRSTVSFDVQEEFESEK